MLLSEWCDSHGERGQQIKSEWTGKAVDGSFIEFNSVTHGCGIKMYWKCVECNHVWESTINNRTATKNSCPMCYERNRGKIVSKSKAAKGETLEYWCKHNTLGDRILKEWTGLCEDGNSYNLYELSSQSNKKMLWVCSNNPEHKWYTKIQKRTLLNSGCPYCSNQKILTGENDLLTWCKNNNKQYLIEQFVGELEDGTPVKMTNLAKSTHKRVKWKHITESGDMHEWAAAVSDRTSKDSGCPLCTGMNNLKSGINDLETWCKNNPIFGKILQDQWLGLDEAGNNIKMSEIAAHSHTNLVWSCKCRRTWVSSPLNRLNYRTELCPLCSRAKAEANRYETVLNNSVTLNDWVLSGNPFAKMIMQEFSGLNDAGDNIDPCRITIGSSKKILWRHIRNGEVHEWYATLKNRVLHMSGCPLCGNNGTSLPEQILYRCIKQVYPNTISRGKFQGYEFDITIPEIRTCIEYGSYYYHKDREHRDLEKKQLCNKHGVRFISILDSSGSDLPDKFEDNSIVCTINSDAKLRIITVALLKTLNIDLNKVNYNKALEESLDFMRK